jgi:GNAT superfamily N-acetyltransferase
MKINIRKGTKEDLPQVLGLIKELAIFERQPEAVTNTIEDMIEDGFGTHPIYGLIVAEDGEKILGMAIYFTKYSTWKGRGIYLEDLLVTESERGKGIGKKLFEEVIKVSKEANAKQLAWQVLDWNEPAIKFYNKFIAELDGEWINGKLNEQQLRNYTI